MALADRLGRRCVRAVVVSVKVGGGLQGEELGVAARKAHELGVGALLGQPALVEQEDAVGLPDRGEAVRDEDRGTSLGERAYPGEQLVFSLGVECRGGLVQDEDRGRPHE